MLNTNTTEKLMAEGGLPQTSPQIPDNSKFEFESVYDFFSPPDTPEFNQIMDPQYENMLRQHAQQINTYAPAAIGNLNTPTPTLASATYNPTRQRTGYDLSTPDGIAALLKDNSGLIKSDKPIIANPIAAGIRESGFDRYYKHSQFSKLGWHPYADNESFYNANSTWWDDFGRMSSQFGNLTKTGFVSAYRSIGDLFDSDSYFSGTDMESAAEFSDAMRIGNSTRGGFAGFANNLALQLGYTTGIIGSIAVEELALFSAAAIQGGFNPVSDAALAGRTTFNLGRLGRSIANAFDVTRFASATRNMYNTLRSVDAAKDFYSTVKTGGKLVGQVFAPETYRAIRTLNSAANGAQNLTNMAKVSKTFGGFYRDLRSLNLALSESKMEGGMVYAQQLANNYDYYSEKNNGSPVTPEQMQLITENASRAAYWTTVQNAPTIFFSNQLLLGNAFGAYNRSLARILNDNIGGLAGRVIRARGFKEAGKIVTRPFVDAGAGLKGFYNTIKAAGVRGSLQMGAHASLRYFAANLAEGIQEVTQEAISHGTKDYHLSILKDPTSGGRNLLSASIASAVSSQWNAQGFETFMSGFLMGGLAQGPQKLLFQGIPNLYQRTFEKEKFEEYKKNKEKYITNLVDSLNDAYEITANDPMSSIFDTNKVNLVAQKQAGIDVMQSMFDNSEFDFVDAKDYAKFQSIYTVLSSGKVSDFRSQFRDYLKMTNDELAEVFPASKADIKSGKVATRMQDMLNKIDQLEDSYNENKDKYRNPFNSSLYKPGTREYGEERIKEMSFEHTRYLYMFTEDGFKRALERSKSIYDELASDPIVGKMAASDITVLLDEKSLAKEITTLVQEITLLDSKESKDIIEAKTNKLKGLQNLFNVLYGPENLNTKGVFDKRKIKKLEEAFQSYVQLLAKSNNTFADSDKIRAALKKIIDYKKLGERAIAYSKSIEYMNNPDRFDEIRNRAYDFYKLIFKNRAEVFRESIKNYISKTEINQFLNELNKLNVIPDPQEVEEFMENGNIDVLKNFYSEDGIVNQNNDQDTYNQIQALINIYKSAVTPEVTEQTAEEKIDSKEKQTRKKDTAEILAEADLAENTPDVEIFGGKETDNPMIKQVLEKKYKEYVNRQVNLGKVPIAMDSWVNSPDAAKYITAYESLKKLWFKDLQSDTKKTDTPEEVLANFNADNGFDKWLETQQTNDFVRKIFRSTETNFSDFIDIEQDFEAGNIEDADIGDVKAVGKVVDNTFNSVQIIETKTSIVDPDTGMPVPVTLYSVRDKKGKLLTEDMTSAAGVPVGATFDNINKARSAAKKLDDVSVDTSTFTFGGKEVSYGSVVTDSEGNRYMVIGTPAEVEKGKKLFLLPVDSIKPGQSKQDRHKLSKKVTEPEFKSEYNVEGFNFNKVPKDASRLLVDEAVALYPLENGMGTAAAEGIMIANARLQTILDNLTPEEKAGLTLVITRNPAGGKTTGKKYQTKDEEGNFKEANPYINRVAEPFAVGIAFGNQQTATRINQIIAEKGMPASSHPDGVFAFVRTGSIQFLNEKNQVVNPINLTKEIIENTFTIYPSQQANAVNTIVNNFAIQQAFVEQVADKMQGKDAAIIPMSEFAEFGFNLGSSVDLRSNPKSVKELKHNTVDGVKVLMINDRKNGIISTRILTDIEDIDEREAFIEKLKQDLATSQPGLFESLQKAQRYVALIKTPNGIYTGAPLKSERLDENTIFNLGKELVEEGIKTINENLDGEGSVETKKIKNKNFNVEFNQAFNRKLYITTNIEGYTVEINVNSDGTFRAELYDKNSKSVIGSSYLAEGRQGTLDYQGVEKPDIIQRLLDNLQTKGIDKAAEEFKAKKKKDSSVEIPEWTKLKLSINNVRASFEEDASIDTVLNNTVTTLNENVRTNYKLRLTANSSTVQEALLFAATTAARQQETEAVKDPTVNLETSEEAYDSVLDMSDEVFDKFAKADFKELPLYMKQQVANKIAKGEKLSLREERIVKNGVAGPLIQLLAGKIQRNTNVDSNAQSLTKELKENRARITEIEREIDTAEPDMVKASELMEDNPERQKLIARNREIERKLIANKIVSEKLNEQEVADIDEFVIWASANLPDFISIDDIYNLRDNLVTNGMRVGAFVLSMSQIASGMTVKGTLYTGVKSPYKYHEAFHGVFRSLLSNAQQDKLYKIAEAEVKRKLGDKFEEELEKFRNSANSYKAKIGRAHV